MVRKAYEFNDYEVEAITHQHPLEQKKNASTERTSEQEQESGVVSNDTEYRSKERDTAQNEN